MNIKKNNVLIILDSKKYKDKTYQLKEEISEICQPDFYFTDYENKLIKFFHGVSIVGNLFTHILYWAVSFNVAINLFIKKRKIYKSIIFINPIVGIFYCFLLALFNKNNNVTIAGFLFVDKKSKIYTALREMFVNFSYKKANLIIVYSRNEVDFYSKRFPNLASKFIFAQYGRDYSIFAEKEYLCDAAYVASGGMSNRDFDTLARALSLLEKEQFLLKCKVATRPDASGYLLKSANLEILHNIRIEMFGSFLAKSIFVVLPLKDTPLSAGHMALLESMFLGKVIIVADIPGIRDYVDENNVIFYKPNNPSNLAKAIQYVYNNQGNEILLRKAALAQQSYNSKYSFSSFLKRIVTITSQY